MPPILQVKSGRSRPLLAHRCAAGRSGYRKVSVQTMSIISAHDRQNPTLRGQAADSVLEWRQSPRRPYGDDGQHGEISSRFWGADRSAPTQAKASRLGRRGAGLSLLIVPQRRLVSNEFPVDGWPVEASRRRLTMSVTTAVCSCSRRPFAVPEPASPRCKRRQAML